MGKKDQKEALAQNQSQMKKRFDTGKINFIGISPLMAIVSSVVTVVALFLIMTKGFNYGIDFAGGTEVQVQFTQAIDIAELRKFADGLGIGSVGVQKFGEANEFLLRFEVAKGKTEKEANEKNNEMIKMISGKLSTQFSAQGVDIRRVDSVGPQIGDELKRNGLLAIFYCLLIILIYVALRFDYKYAPGAVICLFHDAVITMGIFSLIGKEVNVQILAAILTIIGYSLNDTIVNFDRIRENILVFKKQALDAVVNRSINDVLSRTILTSVTTFLAVLALYFVAGGVIADFAFTLGIGVIVGTYSSIYVASPLLLLVEKLTVNKAA